MPASCGLIKRGWRNKLSYISFPKSLFVVILNCVNLAVCIIGEYMRMVMVIFNLTE